MATGVEGDQKAPLSIATTPSCRGRRYSIPWIAPLYSWYVPKYCWLLSKEVSSTIFKVFGMTRPGIEPRSLRPLANTLPTGPMTFPKKTRHELKKAKYIFIDWLIDLKGIPKLSIAFLCLKVRESHYSMFIFINFCVVVS